MSEKSDLRERAREWTTACRTIDLNEHEKEGVGIMLELLQALDDAEREERERCEKIVEEQIKFVSRYMFFIDGRAATVLKERIFAAIRREGGNNEAN